MGFAERLRCFLEMGRQPALIIQPCALIFHKLPTRLNDLCDVLKLSVHSVTSVPTRVDSAGMMSNFFSFLAFHSA